MITARLPFAYSLGALQNQPQTLAQAQSQHPQSRSITPLFAAGPASTSANSSSPAAAARDGNGSSRSASPAAYGLPPLSFSADHKPNDTLWMGDLESWMDAAFIQQLWASLGETVHVKLMRTKSSVSEGCVSYCFVQFSSPQAAEYALLRYNNTIIPRTHSVFKLNWATGGGIQHSAKTRREPEYSVFVGDLDPETHEAELYHTFHSVYPSCTSAKIIIDPVTGMSRKYGFVRFSDEREQQRALSEMQGYLCHGRPLRISVASPRSRTSISADSTTPTGAASTANGGAAASSSAVATGVTGVPSSSSSTRQPDQGLCSIDPFNTTVFVGGLFSGATEKDLFYHFSPFGNILNIKIPPGKGCGFVQYTEKAAAEKAITMMQGALVGPSHIRLAWGHNTLPVSAISASMEAMGSNGSVNSAAANESVHTRAATALHANSAVPTSGSGVASQNPSSHSLLSSSVGLSQFAPASLSSASGKPSLLSTNALIPPIAHSTPSLSAPPSAAIGIPSSLSSRMTSHAAGSAPLSAPAAVELSSACRSGTPASSFNISDWLPSLSAPKSSLLSGATTAPSPLRLGGSTSGFHFGEDMLDGVSASKSRQSSSGSSAASSVDSATASSGISTSTGSLFASSLSGGGASKGSFLSSAFSHPLSADSFHPLKTNKPHALKTPYSSYSTSGSFLF
ncbi:RNA-binding protein Csx1 [Schizosaccharomyces japonicus yFS275]|uniref:RNA-binding protein Csx1 n=1 Tax=Schizosaccharomyces japonicus (strain yFS275 / FY16936) TaxID=402676 RepID=B6K0L7_SCHJY|nr:RNA-binding protein Csx1 [Schizosaccharomyces japonicus yFS275]EEB07488.1 RNA-binding protein Csx1 [Schizosaccharomyces japonicus yFS275]